MEKNNAIEVHEVHKKFKSYYDKSNNLKEKLLHHSRNKYQCFWVLQGISFNVKRGEAVGIIGRNGCGKSTTLKLLTKIIYPDKGSIAIRGRVSSLLELGAGFHPDLSGYENIYLNAAVFGLTRKEIDKRIQDIIRFSELGDFINNPIRTYSSGMYMKLAFSIAINVDADILLIDEILGVGDVSFQKKCFEKLIDIKKRGTTIVIVSHSTDQIERICDRSIWIEKGRIKMIGIPSAVHEKYLDTMEENRILRKRREEEERELERIREQERIRELERQELEKQEQEKAKKELEREKRELERKAKAAKAREEKAQRERKERIEKIELISSQNKKERTQERKQLESLRKERELLRVKNTRTEEDSVDALSLAAIEEEEKRKQEALIKKAKEARQEQETVQNAFKLDEIPEEEIWVEYYKKEANRLELVVSEKNIEIERLNSVVKQKELLLEKEKNNIREELVRLENVVMEKEDEIDRLNVVIVEDHEEMDRLNLVIMQKDVEIDSYRKSLTERNS